MHRTVINQLWRLLNVTLLYQITNSLYTANTVVL